MKRALMLGLLTLIVGLVGTIPARANGSVGAPSAASAGSHGSPATNQPLVSAGTGFTYQGSLKDGASPANGQYDFTFTLFDALQAGNQVGTTVTVLNQTVTNGLFTLTLDFGTAAFQGDARWLQIAVRPNGGGSYTTLAPRQALTAAPYAMSLVPGAVINGATGAGGILLNLNNSSGNGLAAYSGSATDSAIYGVNSNITSTLGVGIKGQGYYYATGVEGASPNGYGVFGHSQTSGGGFFVSTSGAGLAGLSTSGTGGYFSSASGGGLYASSGSGIGLYATSGSDYGIAGVISNTTAAVIGQNTNLVGSAGVGGQFLSASSFGVEAQSTTGTGVSGTSNGSGFGVEGYSSGGVGVYGGGTSGIEGFATGGWGVYGSSAGAQGVYGTSTAAQGVYGTSTGAQGVYGTSSVAQGVYGSSTGNDGVFGTTSAFGSAGVTGVSTSSTSGYGVYGTSVTCALCYAGYFVGRLHATGGCCSGPELNTQIDDPLDPANKVLNQASVESPDRVNIYSGNVTTDAKGEAAVTLPDYASALDDNFRYQLTVIDQFSQAIISSKVKNNIFTIKTDKPNVEVSWQVTGVRHDSYAVSHPMQPEESKPVTQQGK